jgi:hypothetical protein
VGRIQQNQVSDYRAEAPFFQQTRSVSSLISAEIPQFVVTFGENLRGES